MKGSYLRAESFCEKRFVRQVQLVILPRQIFIWLGQQTINVFWNEQEAPASYKFRKKTPQNGRKIFLAKIRSQHDIWYLSHL
jgi:hypothetical protein